MVGDYRFTLAGHDGVRELKRRMVRRKSQSTNTTLQLVLLLCLPALLHYLGVASSMALGTAIVATSILVVANRRSIASIEQSRGGERIRTTGLVVAICLFVAIHLAITAFFLPVETMRSLASLIPLALLIGAGAALARMLRSVPAGTIHMAMHRCFIAMCIVAAFGAIGLSPPSPQPFLKPVFPFSEPSHFALAFIPVLMYVCVTAKRRERIGFLLVGLACAVLLENLTLAAGCVLVALVSLRFWTILTFVVVLTLVATQFDISYFVSRLDFGADNQNLSTLVYLQGWQLIAESWEKSSGFGLGFQQLGVQGTTVDAAELIHSIADASFNLLDGGFTLSKLISEFGGVGVILCLTYLMSAWRAARRLRAIAVAAEHGRIDSPALVFAYCAVVSYLIEMLVRGAGYFTGTGILLVAAFWLLAWANRVSPPAAAASGYTEVRRVRRRITANAASSHSRQLGPE